MSEIKVDTQTLRNVAGELCGVSSYASMANKHVDFVKNELPGYWRGAGQKEYLESLTKIYKKIDEICNSCSSISKKIMKEVSRIEQIEKNNIETAEK